MHAADKGHMEIVQSLLAVPGIKVNIQDKVRFMLKPNHYFCRLLEHDTCARV